MPHPTAPQHLRLHHRLARTAVHLVRAVLAAALLAALLGGFPVALWVYVGWPLPDHVPTWNDVSVFLTTPLTTTRLLNLLACILWPTWALFALDVARAIAEQAAALPHPTMPRPHRPTHALAAALVGMLTLGSLSPTAREPSTAPAVALSEPISLATLDEPAGSTAAPSLPGADPHTAGHRQRTETVRPPDNGTYDSLWRIAQRCLDDGTRWPEIYRLNEGRPQPDGRALTNPALIHPGWQLLLPPTPGNRPADLDGAGATEDDTSDEPHAGQNERQDTDDHGTTPPPTAPPEQPT
ncbi:LysM peptidoglycan-binding domain-containing protein, partial [Streptomyces sp. 4N509B]|uniref:LysM peptidoglycan-binding domain-containing protein n=1 Tax=Streptomyces sp. 4N509B TaxID=3457413 RepID=UPI003FD5A4D0